MDPQSSQYQAILESVNAWYWAISKNINLVGGKFSMNEHEFQVRPMTIWPKIKVIMKATQEGWTEMEVLKVLFGMINRMYPVGVYYLFPTILKVSEFSRARFKPLIRDNPVTIGAHVRDTDSTTLKRIGNAFLYFRSGRLSQDIEGDAKSSSGLKGDPCDHAVHDEYDEMDQAIDEFVDGRLAKSRVRTKSYLANPTLPDYGIDKKFALTDQEYWFSKCRKCNEYTCYDLEESFPELIRQHTNGTWYRACKKCGSPVDTRLGQWVPMRPSITDKIGFTRGHPSDPWIDLENLMEAWNSVDLDLANFTRMRLGRAYIESEHRLSVEQVLALCGSGGILQSDRGPCFMGVDQGKLLHVVITREHPSRSGEVVHLGEYKDFSELDTLMDAFRVQRCVIDGEPETREAKSFAGRFQRRVFLCRYSEHQTAGYAWNEKEFSVKVNRTESLDASAKEIQNGAILLPKKCDIVDKFAKHLHNVGKKLEEDKHTKSVKYRYITFDKHNDHFRHAWNYECIARHNAPKLLFPSLMYR